MCGDIIPEGRRVCPICETKVGGNPPAYHISCPAGFAGRKKVSSINRSSFYFLNIVWGFPMNIIGSIVAIGLLIVGKHPTCYGGCLCFTAGRDWGGVSFGLVMVVSDRSSELTKNHELGHAVQNAIYGVFMPFIVSIPSAIRYWYRRCRDPDTLPPYDSIWFEGQATKLGEKYRNRV